MKAFLCAGLSLGIMLAAAPAQAQADKWPSKAIQLVVPYTPGGSTDTLGRIVAQKLSARLGQTVIVENIAGANGSLGARSVARSEPTGYSLLLANMGILTINPHLYANMGFNPRTDLQPVRMAASLANLLVVRADLPANDINGLIGLAKAQPGKLTYVSAGIGSSQHLAGVLFSRATDTNLMHVPYKGGSPALQDMLAGRVDMMFANFSEVRGLVESRKLKGIAFGKTSAQYPLPNIPPMSTVVPGFEISNWYGILARAGTPPEIVQKLEKALGEALEDSDLKTRLAKLDFDVTPLTSKEFEAVIDADYARWGKIVKEVGITVD